jgi:ankyrin repeat protein
MSVFGAIEANDVDRVRELVRADPQLGKQRDEDGVSALLWAKYYGRDEIADELVRPEPELDVFEAAAYGRAERLSELLDADEALANAWSPDGFQPLGLAVFFGHPRAASLVLERGADPRAPARHAQIKAAPIHSAAAASDARARRDLAELLLDHGADPAAAQDSGFTALHAAAQHGDLELASLLLERGADAHAVTADGRTPAAIAREQGNDELAELLGD